MNIVVIHDSGVETYKTWREAKKANSYEKEEFAQIGIDYVLNLTGDSYEVVKDIKQLERVASQKVFSKDKFDSTNWMQVLILILVLLVYTKGG